MIKNTGNHTEGMNCEFHFQKGGLILRSISKFSYDSLYYKKP